jgi:membrane protease YdiL (CAAX protease family)
MARPAGTVQTELHPIRPARWQERATAALEVLLCSSLPTQLLVATVLAAFGLAAQTDDARLSSTFVLLLSLGDSVLLIGLMLVLLRAHGESPVALWRGTRPLLREAALGLYLVPLVFATVVVLLVVLRLYVPWLHNVPDNPLEQIATGGTRDAVMLGAVAIVGGGIREELQRAFLLHRFEHHLGGATVGVVVLSTAFGAGHYMQGWDAAIVTGALGALWAVVYLRRRSSVAPIVSHAGFNGVEVLRVALASVIAPG